MNLEELRIKYKDDILRIAEKYGVTNIRVFGSVARGDAKEDSDVDFLVNISKDRSAFDLGGFYSGVEDLLERRIDVVTPKMVHWYIKEKVLNEAKPL